MLGPRFDKSLEKGNFYDSYFVIQFEHLKRKGELDECKMSSFFFSSYCMTTLFLHMCEIYKKED